MPCIDRCDGVSCLLLPPPPLPTHIARLLREPGSETAKSDGNRDGSAAVARSIDDSIVDVDHLDLHLARFLSTLPSCWCSRQRVAVRASRRRRRRLPRPGLVLLPLCESVMSARGATVLAREEEQQRQQQLLPPTLSLVAVDDDGEEEEEEEEEEDEFPSSFSLSSFSSDDNFQVLAAIRSRRGLVDEFVRRAESLASRLGRGCGGNGEGGGQRWSWRPLSNIPTTAESEGKGEGDDSAAVVVLCQLFPSPSPSPSSPSSASSSFLVATDYDYTLVDDNSDTRVVGALGASDVLEDLYKRREMEWTEAVDGALAAGAARVFERGGGGGGGGAGEEKVLSAAASAPCSSALREAVLAVAGCRCRNGKKKKKDDKRNDLAIFSDANDVFIEQGLRGNGLVGGCSNKNGSDDSNELSVVAVATNPARFVDVDVDAADPANPGRRMASYRRLALSRATTRYGGHGCGRCPSNLCKGELLSKLLVSSPRAPYGLGVAYLGDGSNDVCPAARCLGPGDVALARERYGPGGRRAAFGAAVLLSSKENKSNDDDDDNGNDKSKKVRLLCRSVVGWTTQDELARALLREARKRGALVE